MPSANTLYALHTLEPGKRYVAFSPENDGTWLWEGRLLALTWNCELAVIEQRDDSLGVVWNWNFPEGVRANYHEVLPEEQLCDVPRINTGAEQAQRAAMLLMTIPGRSVASEPVSALMHSCNNDRWHYEEQPNGTSLALDSETSIRSFHGREGYELAVTVRRLLEMANKLCTCKS